MISQGSETLRFTGTVEYLAGNLDEQAKPSNRAGHASPVGELHAVRHAELVTVDDSKVLKESHLIGPRNSVFLQIRTSSRGQVVHEQYEDVVSAREAVRMGNLGNVPRRDDGVEGQASRIRRREA